MIDEKGQLEELKEKLETYKNAKITRTCENCHYNYQFVKEPDGSILETEKGERCQNHKSAFYNQDCKAVRICGKWAGHGKKKTANWCKCYCEYPNPNHKYCNEFINIKEPGMCIRRGIFKKCEKCLNLPNCETIRKIATLKNITFSCTDFKE